MFPEKLSNNFTSCGWTKQRKTTLFCSFTISVGLIYPATSPLNCETAYLASRLF